MKTRSHQAVKSSADSISATPSQALQARPFTVQTKPTEAEAQPWQAQLQQADVADFNLAHNLGLQAKLTVGQPDDQYEQEADRVAAQVVEQMNAPQAQQSVQRQTFLEEEELMMKPQAGGLQPASTLAGGEGLTIAKKSKVKESIKAKEKEKEKEKISKKEENHLKKADAQTASPTIESDIMEARGQGLPLSSATLSSMEKAFGTDFSGVRIHTDERSDQLNASLQARAFTTGQDIFFKRGEFNPGSRSGQELLAHELTHVVQQHAGSASAPSSECVSAEANSTLEVEANHLEEPVTIVGNNPGVQRQTEQTESSLLVQRAEDESLLAGAWNFLTNNSLAFGAGLLEEAGKVAPEAAGSSPYVGSMAQGASRTAGLGGGAVGRGGGMLGKFLGPLGLVSGVMGMADAISPGTEDDRNGLQRGGDFVASGLGTASSAVTTLGLLGSGATMAGGSSLLAGTGTGAALTSTGAGATGLATAAAPAAAVLGSAAGGYALGRLGDEAVGGLMNWTGASAALDRLQGISRPEGQSRDASLSGLGADAALGADSLFTSAMRGLGVYDESAPEYTQTIGWRLAEILPSWMQ